MTHSTNHRSFIRLVAAVLLVASLAASLSPAFAQNGGGYTVKSGDTLTKIARLYNTTVSALVDLNKAQFPCLATTPACLRVGWVLTVPGGVAASPTTSTNPGSYVVKAGDSPARIANKFGITLSALLAANKTSYPCLTNATPCALQIGWTLIIPGGVTTAAATTVGTAPIGDPAALLGQYVAAVNARNAAALKALMHPDVITAETDDDIEELFYYIDVYQLSFQLGESRVTSQSASEAQVHLVITGDSKNYSGFTTETEGNVVLKPYQGAWRLYDASAARLEFIR